MPDVFEDDPDDRQTQAATPAHSLFRKRYRQLSDDELKLHDAIKDKADELAALFDQVGKIQDRNSQAQLEDVSRALGAVLTQNGAHVTLALRHLEDAVYRAVKALTA
jgi:hypothetical protein